jgi:ethanolamine ammonia-lyase small subunit
MTPARIALGRTGDSLPTGALLDFQLAHAKARDAVHTLLDAASLAQELADFSPVIVHSEARGRTEYLHRPDLGRQLATESAERLSSGPYDAVIVIADGLSAVAAQSQAAQLHRDLRHACAFAWAPPVIALQARVALGDEIASRLGAALVIMLIGERPGLTAADSLGAYLTYEPRPGITKDADRNCISNIRPGGLTIEEAVRRIAALAHMARAIKRTGTALKEDDALALFAPAPGMIRS